MEKTPLAPLTKSVQRLLWVGLFFCGWALIVVLRLVDLQVLAHERFVRMAQSQQERLTPLEAPRGTIFDRNGHVLAISSKSQIVVVNPLRIPDKDIASSILGKILHIDSDKLMADLTVAADRRHGYFIVSPQVDADQAEALRSMNLDWLEVRNGSIRTYPNGSLAAHVVGNVNAEGSGSSGVELKLNKDLAGKAGLLRVTSDVKHRGYESQIEREPEVGKNLMLTIDSQLQYAAEEALRQAVKTNHADHGSVIAMDPNTGEILALANYPTFDPNERLHAGERPRGREDLAVVAPFEPGSVFKVITVSAAMETTRLHPDTVINCGNGILKMPGRIIHDTHPYPSLSVANVLAKSSNIGAIRIGMTVGNEGMYDYIRRFGFGKRTGIELPAEAPGLIRPLKRWKTTSIGSVAMGHEVSVTSVQLAQAAAVLANGGLLVRPHLVMWKQPIGGLKEIPQRAGAVRALKPQTVITMRKMMEGVVMKGGTAPKAHLLGYTTAGKTGTAQIYDFSRRVYTHKYNASFLGFAPVANPKVVVVATVSGTTGAAGFGGLASGPVFKTVASLGLRLLGVPPDAPEMFDEEDEKSKNKGKGVKSAPEEVSIAELSEPPTIQDARQAAGEIAAAETVESLTISGPKAPSFLGKSIKDVMVEAAESGLAVDLRGRGLARAQTPMPGSVIPPGEHIQVRFAR